MPRCPRRRVSRGPSKRPARRTALTVEAIVAAAIEVLDEGGVVGLSMRRVADQLGTGAASLYAHVSGKDELLELVFDELVGQVPLPEPDPKIWREQVRQMLRDLRAVLISHRDAALAGLGPDPDDSEGAGRRRELARRCGRGAYPIARSRSVSISSPCTCRRRRSRRGLMEHGGMTRRGGRAVLRRRPRLLRATPGRSLPGAGFDRRRHDRVRTGTSASSSALDVLIAGLEAVSAPDAGTT